MKNIILLILAFGVALISACGPRPVSVPPVCVHDECESAWNSVFSKTKDRRTYQHWNSAPYDFLKATAWVSNSFLSFGPCQMIVDPTLHNCVTEFNIVHGTDTTWMRFYPHFSTTGDLMTNKACSDTARFTLLDTHNIATGFGYTFRSHDDTLIVQLLSPSTNITPVLGPKYTFYK